MFIIPVIDLSGNLVVHAKRGQRKSYQPIKSVISASAEPESVLSSFLELYHTELVSSHCCRIRLSILCSRLRWPKTLLKFTIRLNDVECTSSKESFCSLRPRSCSLPSGGPLGQAQCTWGREGLVLLGCSSLVNRFPLMPLFTYQTAT